MGRFVLPLRICIKVSRNGTAKPFLKWAGGKTQLINTIENALPKDIYSNKFHNFFESLYSEFHIQRVEARRSINANPEKRGALKELLIKNQL